MMYLEKSLAAWGEAEFEAELKREVEHHALMLPLQKALSMGSYVLDKPITMTVIGIEELAEIIYVRAGIYFQSVIGGCSCTDDPSPVNEINEYCEVRLAISKLNAETLVTLL